MRFLGFAALAAALAGCVNVDVDLGTRRGHYTEKVVDGDADADSKIALIDVQGILTSDQDDSFFSLRESQVVSLVEKLKLAEADKAVKAVVLRVDSPCGDVTTSDILYNELVSFK